MRSLVTTGRLCKKRAEILLIIGDTKRAKTIFRDSKTTYYSIIDEAIDLMKTALKLYEAEWGPNHYKTYEVATQLGRLEYLAGHAAPTSAQAMLQFNESNLSFSRLIKTHERHYKQLNDNCRTDNEEVKGTFDDGLVLHQDI